MGGTWTDPDIRRVSYGALLARNAQRTPEHIVYQHGDRRLSWAQLEDRVNRLAAALRSSGLRAGDRVAVLMANSLGTAEIHLASCKLGAICVPVNFRLVSDEVAYILSDSEPTILFTDEHHQPTALDAVSRSGRPITVVSTATATGSGVGRYEDMLATPACALGLDVPEDSPAFIMYTSGTTGRPKGAVLTQLNLVMAALAVGMATGGRPSRPDTRLLSVPMFRIAGLTNVLGPLLDGGRVVLQESGDFDPAADTFPDTPAHSAFGMTETSSVTTLLSGSDAIRKMGSVGKPIPLVEVRLVDDDMRDVPVGEVGEIVYRGPTVLREYWRNPDATAEAFAGGWFHSGDLCRMDDEGFVWVVDRKKDMIISGGENIYCAEVEEAVRSHPAVADVAVVGIAHPRWVQTPCAVITAADAAGACRLARRIRLPGTGGTPRTDQAGKQEFRCGFDELVVVITRIRQNGCSTTMAATSATIILFACGATSCESPQPRLRASWSSSARTVQRGD